MFDRDYGKLIQLAGELEQFSGFLSTEEQKRSTQVTLAYRKEVDRIAYELLKDKRDIDEIAGLVSSDLDAISVEQPGWVGTIGTARSDLIERLRTEAGKSSWSRAVRRYAMSAIGILLVIGYFGLWYFNDLTIDQPIESKAGLIQRAEAYQKSRRYEEWAAGETTRHGWLKALALKPFEPDEKEIQASVDFVGIVHEGYQALEREALACDDTHLLNQNSVNFADLKLADTVAAHVLAKGIKWTNPPAFTLLEPIGKAQPCDNPAIGVTGRQ